VLLIGATCTFLSPRDALAGKLDRVSDAARSPGTSSSGSSNSNSSSSYHSDPSDSDGDDIGGAVFLFYAITSPWWGPIAALEPDRPDYSVGFPRYPYETPHAGSMIVEREPGGFGPLPPEPEPKRNWAFQLGAETGYVIDRVFRDGLNLRFQTAYRVDFDANWSLFMERQPGAYTNLAMGREHLVWRFAQSSAVQFHTSFGAQHLVDSRGDVSGVDFAYGFEVYPTKPLTFAVEGALGNLNASFAPRVRTTLGMLVNQFEFLLGYEHQWIGTESLGGPFAGVRLWL